MQKPGPNKLSEEEVKDLRAWYHKGNTKTEEELMIIAKAYNRTVKEIRHVCNFRRKTSEM